MVKVGVIGAGVNGLSCALRIKERFPSINVTIITKSTSPNTTGDGAGGLWGPFLLGSTPPENILKWSKVTHDFYFWLWRQGLASSSLIPCIRISKDDLTPPEWAKATYGFVDMEEKNLALYKKMFHLEMKSGHKFVTFVCETSILLNYLMDRFTAAGGLVKFQEIHSIDEMQNDYDVIVNCAGLSSKIIVPDNNVSPIRGQVARVKAPWIYHTVMDDSDDGNYIIPNIDSCVLGGTHQENDFNLNIDSNDSKFIRDGCEKIIPSLKNEDILYEWVGLRPGRHCVRLEKEIRNINGKELPVIHNYGHGGSGFTLFWGCSADVLDIFEDILKSNIKSKL